jgi:NADPH:quinone reductase-like Zn-dependent oxidoreductase
MKATQITQYGTPIEVAKCVEMPDVGDPKANEVVIDLEASPINQYDLLMIAGGYGYHGLAYYTEQEGVGRSRSRPVRLLSRWRSTALRTSPQ